MMNKIVLTLITLTSILSCNVESPGPDFQKIGNALKLKNESYVSENLTKCKTDMIRKAESFVDSLITENINLQLSDSIFFPEKPLKPIYQGPIIISDTVIAKPIFPPVIKQIESHDDTINL
ncbi:MAG: hypothetical protein IPM42_11560 [Saprospiraceae bacterium]|nr:hypothetical protein [Saprospiraceae bacterium]